MDIYDIFKKITDFEWDKGNIEKNIAKHNIKNSEAEEVFFNFNIINFDEKHSISERRYFLLGITNENKILFVVFTIRNNPSGVLGAGKIRIISSRIASDKEREIFRREYKKYEKL